MPRVIHFEIPADDPERATAFYGKVFGWQSQKWDGPMPYWLVKTGQGPGIDGGILPRKHPGQTTINTVDFANLDESVSAAEANGGKVVAPRMPIPGIGYLAYCQDPDGNIFGMLQMDSSAH